MSCQPHAAALLKELKSLASHAGEMLFRRIEIAHQLLNDEAWASENDVESLAVHFPDIHDHWTVRRLTSIIAEFPNIETWRDNHFDLMAMYNLQIGEAFKRQSAQTAKEAKEYKRQKWRESSQRSRERIEKVAPEVAPEVIFAKCSPRDAAERIYQMVLDSAEPELLASQLAGMLAATRFKDDLRTRQREKRLAGAR